MRRIAVGAMMLLLPGCSSDTSAPDPMTAVNAERAFAAAAAETTMRDAFVQFAADDAIMFVPQAVRVKEYYADREGGPALLQWEPVFAEIASSGDLAWTTGPWDWRQNPEADSADAFGQYNTVWKLQPDSTWKFVLDIGVAHGPHSAPEPALAVRVVDTPERISGDLDADRNELIQLEYTFSSTSSSEGLAAAYVPLAADDIRICRMGSEPIIGVSDLSDALGSVEGSWTWEPARADVSASGDLGYTFGVSTLVKGETARMYSFAHVWRKDATGLWRLALDVHIPIPPPSREENDG